MLQKTSKQSQISNFFYIGRGDTPPPIPTPRSALRPSIKGFALAYTNSTPSLIISWIRPCRRWRFSAVCFQASTHSYWDLCCSPSSPLYTYHLQILNRHAYSFIFHINIIMREYILRIYLHREVSRKIKNWNGYLVSKFVVLTFKFCQLDQQIVSLLLGISNQPDSPLARIGIYQLATKDTKSTSWFIYSARRLARYKIDALGILHQVKRTPRT